HGLGLDRSQRGGHVVERGGGGDDLARTGARQSIEVELAAVDLEGLGGQLLEGSGQRSTSDEDPAETDQRQETKKDDLPGEALSGRRGLRQRGVVEVLRCGCYERVEIGEV